MRTHFPDVEIPAELVREQVLHEIELVTGHHGFDPSAGHRITTIDSETSASRIAFAAGENGQELCPLT